jgi:hypothetical protein
MIIGILNSRLHRAHRSQFAAALKLAKKTNDHGKNYDCGDDKFHFDTSSLKIPTRSTGNFYHVTMKACT